MGISSSEKVMNKASTHILNISRLLKRVKSNISVNFIHADNKGLL